MLFYNVMSVAIFVRNPHMHTGGSEASTMPTISIVVPIDCYEPLLPVLLADCFVLACSMTFCTCSVQHLGKRGRPIPRSDF